VIGFTGLMLFVFLMGLRHAPLDARTLRNVAEMVVSLLLIPVLVDVMRDSAMLRRAVLALMLVGTLSALIGIGLWLLPDLTAESILNRLGRLEYPVGGVIRRRETPGALLNERAIGTWIDPNAFGGFLVLVGALIAPQVFSQQPVIKRRYAAGCCLVFAALFLTDSRGSMLSLGTAFVFIAALRYRRLLLIMIVAGVIALFLPFTQRYIDKLEAGFTNQDVETQMRFGEYKDALILIGRHPVIGAGFSGVPEIDLYFGVASTYLTIASHAGFVGLAAYLLMMLSVYIYSFAHYRSIQSYPALTDVWLGLAAALVGVLVGGIFDHFYFKIDQFHATMTFVWIIFGLMLSAVRLSASEL
jgi:O-antigen ligase